MLNQFRDLSTLGPKDISHAAAVRLSKIFQMVAGAA